MRLEGMNHQDTTAPRTALSAETDRSGSRGMVFSELPCSSLVSWCLGGELSLVGFSEGKLEMPKAA